MELASFNFNPDLPVSILIILGFTIIGAGLKYIDDAFDEEIFSKKIAVLIAPILVTIAGILAIKDIAAEIILFSILLSVLICGKVDNWTFKLSAVAFLVLVSSLSLSFGGYGIFMCLWLPLAIITATGVVDEKGNDYADKRNKKSPFGCKSNVSYGCHG
jgi:hypothetical protein